MNLYWQDSIRLQYSLRISYWYNFEWINIERELFFFFFFYLENELEREIYASDKMTVSDKALNLLNSKWQMPCLSPVLFECCFNWPWHCPKSLCWSSCCTVRHPNAEMDFNNQITKLQESHKSGNRTEQSRHYHTWKEEGQSMNTGNKAFIHKV